MIDAEKLDYVKRYLRRTKTLAELKTLADTVFETATDTVTLTSNNYEGGGASGQVTFEKALIGAAIEDLIAEQDTDVAAAQPAHERYAQFHNQRLQT